MSQPRVALSIADRIAARLSRVRPWAQSQPISSGNRNRPVLNTNPSISTQSQSTSSTRISRPALRSVPSPSIQPQSTSSTRISRPALRSVPSPSIQPQSTSSIRMNRPALHSSPPASAQPQPISRIRTRPALRSSPPASTQPQSIPSIRINRPALQPVTTARLVPSIVDSARSPAVLDRAKARRERLAAVKPADARDIANQSFSAVISEVRRLQARIAAYEARKAERNRAAQTSRQQVVNPAASTRSQRRPRAPSPMTLLVESLDFRNLPAARSAPPPPAAPLLPVVSPPTPLAPRASRFHDVNAPCGNFQVFHQHKDPPSQLKGILWKTNRRYKSDCKGERRCCLQHPGPEKRVAFATEVKVHAHEKWIGIWQGTETEDQLFTDLGHPISGRGLHVCPNPERLLGQLRGWLPSYDDKFSHTYFHGMNWRDHSNCSRGLTGGDCMRGLYHKTCAKQHGEKHKLLNVPLKAVKRLEPRFNPPSSLDSPWRFVKIPHDPEQVPYCMPLHCFQRFLRPTSRPH